MRQWITLCEGLPDNNADTRALLAKTKEQRKRLDTDIASLTAKRHQASDRFNITLRNAGPEEQETMQALYKDFVRKQAVWDRLRLNMTHRAIALSHQIALLRAKLNDEKTGMPQAMFSNISTQQTKYQKTYLHEIGQMIDRADENLEYPAEQAITSFVGHGYSKTPEEGTPGIWSWERLEDAYSNHPSERGMTIRNQLEAGIAPIKAALHKLFGDHITIHRAQRALTGDEAPRLLLSWTSDLRFAQSLIDDGSELMTKEILIDDIVWITDRANQSEFIVKNRPMNEAKSVIFP